MFRFWQNFPFMVGAGLVAGFVTGGFPSEISGSVQQLMLIVAMGFSLTEISFRGIAPAREVRGIALSAALSYGLLGSLVIAFGLTSPDPSIRSGWVLMGVVPPAIGVVPITSLLRGNVRSALISEAALYFLGLVTVPGLCLLFLGETVPVQTLAIQTLLLIGIPTILSRPLRRWNSIGEARPIAVSVAFFFLVAAIAGSTRDTLLREPALAASLSLLAIVRTFGVGLAIIGGARLLRASRESQVAAVTFGGFKNLGLTVVLAFTVFGPLASLPAITALIFEAAWMSLLPLLFRSPNEGLADTPG